MSLIYCCRPAGVSRHRQMRRCGCCAGRRRGRTAAPAAAACSGTSSTPATGTHPL